MRTLLGLLALVVVAAACSSDPDPASTTTPAGTPDAAETVGEQLVAELSEQRWDADCIRLLDEALGLAQDVIDAADPLTPEQLADQSDALTAGFEPVQADLATRFSALECSQFWWDISLVERSETLHSTSVAGFVTKFGFLETSVTNIAREYGPAVGLMVDATPAPLPGQPDPPGLESCDDVFRALLAFQSYQVDLADHLATLPATPPAGYDEFAASYAAATQDFADENGCDAVEAAEHIIANEQQLSPDNVYGSFAKYLAFAALLRQADFA